MLLRIPRRSRMWSHRREVTEPGSRNLNIVGEEGKRRKTEELGKWVEPWVLSAGPPGSAESRSCLQLGLLTPGDVPRKKMLHFSRSKEMATETVYWSKRSIYPLLGVEGRERSGEQPGNRIRILNENVLRPNSWAYSSSVTYWLTLEIVQYHFFHSLLKTGH